MKKCKRVYVVVANTDDDQGIWGVFSTQWKATKALLTASNLALPEVKAHLATLLIRGYDLDYRLDTMPARYTTDV